MKIGLYFGTFNPVHIGHMAIANHMVEFSDLDEVWFVVTPHNPFKKKKSLLADNHRFQMVRIATEDYPKLKPSKIEFNLPQPNYTVHTLAHLSEKYPHHEFSLIMGEDNLSSFHKWKNPEVIVENHRLYVYPRLYKDKPEKNANIELENVQMVNAPIMEVSSTFIRKAIASEKNIKPLLPCKVWQYLDEMNFYKN